MGGNAVMQSVYVEMNISSLSISRFRARAALAWLSVATSVTISSMCVQLLF